MNLKQNILIQENKILTRSLTQVPQDFSGRKIMRMRKKSIRKLRRKRFFQLLFQQYQMKTKVYMMKL